MLVQKAQRKWETKPLDSWEKAKELRAKFYSDETTAKDRGLWLIEGRDSTVCAGIGDCHVVFCQPSGATISITGDEWSRRCRAATEGKGYGRDICGYDANYIGAMLSNRGLRDGEFQPRDCVMPGADACNMFWKFPQIEAELFNIPMHYMDNVGYYGPTTPEREAARVEYLVAQRLEEIEWLEKFTGRKFDDEDFIETTKSQMRIQAMRGELIECLQAIPTPLDQKSLYSIFILGGLVRSQQEETERFWQILRDEMKWRVENQIAAVATERYRWVENEPPPWFFLRYYRYMEEYGAVCIGSPYTHGTSLIEQPDETFKRPKTPMERGEVQFNTREDVIRFQIRERRGESGWGGHGPEPEQYFSPIRNMIKAFHCDGAILPLHRTGIGCVFGERTNAIKMMDLGVPFMHYETSHPGNRTDFDENRLLDQLDTFMEIQGLRRLEVED